MKISTLLLPFSVVLALGLSACGSGTEKGEGAAAPTEGSESAQDGGGVDTTDAVRGEEVAVPEPAPSPAPASTPAPAPDEGEMKRSTPEDVEARKNASWNDQRLHDEIRHYNPNYTGQGQFQIEGGKVLRAMLAKAGIVNLECFRGMSLLGLDLSGNAVKDLSPLKGHPLEAIYLEDTAVEDLTPLRGAPIREFYAARTPLHNLIGLEGAPIEQFNVVGSRVADLSALKGAPLQMVWLTDCPVSDVSALVESPLVSLTLHRTKITDLSPLAGTRLQRLHIGETMVTDLTPLATVPLTRLVFTPPLIEKGIDAVKSISTMREIGHKFDDSGRELVAPAKFWHAYDEVIGKKRAQEAQGAIGSGVLAPPPAPPAPASAE